MEHRVNAAAIALLVLLVQGQAVGSAPHPRASLNKHLLLDTDQLDRLLNEASIDLVVVDFGRSKMEYLDGHIPGAVHMSRSDVLTTIDGIPGMLPAIVQVREVIEQAGIGNDTRVVVYDDSHGLWASRLFWTLEYLGHKRVAMLDGGLSSWVAEDRVLQSKEVTKPRASFQVRIQANKLADKAWIIENLENTRVKVVDTRSPAEYTGSDKQAARGGHIPGASNIDWVQNLDMRKGTFLPTDTLVALYEQAEATRDRKIVTHCQTGIRAAHAYFTLRLLGYEEVRLYDGSWAEWGNSEDTPIE